MPHRLLRFEIHVCALKYACDGLNLLISFGEKRFAAPYVVGSAEEGGVALPGRLLREQFPPKRSVVQGSPRCRVISANLVESKTRRTPAKSGCPPRCGALDTSKIFI